MRGVAWQFFGSWLCFNEKLNAEVLNSFNTDKSLFVVDTEARSNRYEQNGAGSSYKLDVEWREQVWPGGAIPALPMGDANYGARGVVSGLAACVLCHLRCAFSHIFTNGIGSR